MDRPTAADVRIWSKVDFGELNLGDDADLQLVVDQANAYIEWVTGRALDSSMPKPLEPVAKQASRMRTEQVAFQAVHEYVESAADDIVGSFHAGGYSETRHDPNRRGESRSLNSWPALTEILWILLTTTPLYPNAAVDEMRDYWRYLLSNATVPSFEVTEVAWGLSGLARGVALGAPGLGAVDMFRGPYT